MIRWFIVFVAAISFAAFFTGLLAGEYRWMHAISGVIWLLVLLNWRRVTHYLWGNK